MPRYRTLFAISTPKRTGSCSESGDSAKTPQCQKLTGGSDLCGNSQPVGRNPYRLAISGQFVRKTPDSSGDGYVSGDLIEQDREELETEIKDAETEFRAALLKHSGSLEWRSTVAFTSLADYLADQARCADLVIIGVDRSASIFDSSRHVDIGDLVMRLGRPTLIVPAAAGKVSLERVLIGWN